MKKLKIEETKATWYSTFITDIIKMGLVFSIFNFLINKIGLANIWMSFSCNNLALVNVKTMRHIAQDFVAFSEKLNFKFSNDLCAI